MADNEKAIVIRAPMAVASFEELKLQATQLDQFYRGLMKLGTDYDTIPGTHKPTLLKAGAELLRLWANLTPEFEVNNCGTDLIAGLFSYEVKCKLSRPGYLVGEGVGNCNSLESKYRYRWVFESGLPEGADKAKLTRRMFELKSGKKVPQYRLDNENPQDLANTILKMAKKRAFVDAILTVTGASRIFTQDIEDGDETQREVETGRASPPTQELAIAPPSETEHFCKEHNCKFFRHEKNKRVWYSHKQGDGYCNEPSGAKQEAQAGDTLIQASEASVGKDLFEQDESESLRSPIDPGWFMEQLLALQAKGFKNWSNDNVLNRLNTMTGAGDDNLPAALSKLTQEQAVKILARIEETRKA